jgi:hypothetical protein
VLVPVPVSHTAKLLACSAADEVTTKVALIDVVRLSLNATDSAPVPGGTGGQITVAAHEVQTDVLVYCF